MYKSKCGPDWFQNGLLAPSWSRKESLRMSCWMILRELAGDHSNINKRRTMSTLPSLLLYPSPCDSVVFLFLRLVAVGGRTP